MKNERIYGLLGRHLGHSYSPMIHKELGTDNYLLIEKEPEEVEDFVRSKNIGGFNVTIPYKKTVMPLCDVLSAAAKSVGSVNTVAALPDGKILGHNTDVDGFLYMAKRAGISFAGKKVVIFGSGGAHMAVKYAVSEAGAKSIITVSRTGEENYDNISRHYDADILVNATPVGMFPDLDEQIIDISHFEKCSGVLDLIYNPYRTNLVLQAEKLGIPYGDGLAMLVEQARCAGELFQNRAISEEETLRIWRKIACDMRSIVLIGMPGSGKTTIGELLSQISGKPVIDTDAEIEKESGMTIPEIFAKGGEMLFREMECEAVEKACMEVGKIIVTGGGAVKSERNYNPLRRIGRVYHIERDIEELPTDGRPLSQSNDLSDMYAERFPLYMSFRDMVVSNNGTPQETAQAIWRDFCENSCY